MAHILVVDDQAAARVLLKSILSHAGHRTLTAEDGVEALELLSHHPETDVLITDIDMPRMDGLALLEHLQADTRLIKLVVTAHDRREHRERAQALGSAGFFEKPFNSQVLLKAVTDLLDDRPRPRA